MLINLNFINFASFTIQSIKLSNEIPDCFAIFGTNEVFVNQAEYLSLIHKYHLYFYLL